MRKSEWSDNELKQLLSEMPKIKDYRDPRDIYQNLSIKANKRKRWIWIIPSVATAAAVLMLILVAPNIWQNVKEDSKSNGTVALEKKDQKMEMAKKVPRNAVSNENPEAAKYQGFSENSDISLMSAPIETAIYSEDVVNQEVITYLVPDQNVQILVPVSIVVPKEDKTWLDLFQSNSERLTEQQWGLSDYYPLKAKLTMVNDHTLNVDVPDEHVYGNGSASENTFNDILQQMMNNQSHIKKITMSTNGKPGIIFGNIGDRKELNYSDVSGKHSYYLFNPNASNLPFLVPFTTTYADVRTAFGSMITDLEDFGLKSPLSFQFTINNKDTNKEELVLSIEHEYQLTNEPKDIYAIEAILLTAKEFGYKSVKFENASPAQIGRFHLESGIKVPIAPNEVFLP